MIHRQINKSTGIALIALLLSLVLVVGCGGSSTPEAPDRYCDPGRANGNYPSDCHGGSHHRAGPPG